MLFHRHAVRCAWQVRGYVDEHRIVSLVQHLSRPGEQVSLAIPRRSGYRETTDGHGLSAASHQRTDALLHLSVQGRNVTDGVPGRLDNLMKEWPGAEERDLLHQMVPGRDWVSRTGRVCLI